MALKNKYQREKQQYSVDGGTTWIDVSPPNYRKGRLLAVGHNGDDCNEPDIYDGEYFTTEALGSGTIGLTTTAPYPPLTNIAYSKNNGEWTTITYGETINVINGDIIKWKANGYTSNNVIGTSYSDGYTTYTTRFNSTADYIVYGNPKSLLYSDNFPIYDETGKYVLFRGLFSSNNKLIDAENLIMPTNVAIEGFLFMFSNCTRLTSAPALPSTTLMKSCYEGMFEGCTSLVNAPALPATTLAQNCYFDMFAGCTSLTTPPVLISTTMETGCYSGMFKYCTSLTTPPALSATSLAIQCYGYMFQGCTSLELTPYLPATTLVSNCYFAMFKGCTSLKYVPDLPSFSFAQDAVNSCASMFENCTSLTSAPALPATTLANNCYWNMFKGCTSLTTAPQLPATTLANHCYESMFDGCTSLKYAPTLPAKDGVTHCYDSMFKGCTSLKYILCNLDEYNNNWTYDWVKDVPSTGGTFIYDCMTDWESGNSGYPTNWNKSCS